MRRLPPSVLIREELDDLLHGDVDEGTNIISTLVETVTRLVVQELLVDLYWDQGLTLKEIGEKLGASLRTVHRRMMEADVPRRNLGSRPAHGDLPQRPAEVLTPKFLTNTYVQKRLTMKQIAQQTGFSVGSVRRYLISAGIPIRTARY